LQLGREEDGQRPQPGLDAVGGEALSELILDLLDERVVALQWGGRSLEVTVRTGAGWGWLGLARAGYDLR
jgi:hypothetical protein